MIADHIVATTFQVMLVIVLTSIISMIGWKVVLLILWGVVGLLRIAAFLLWIASVLISPEFWENVGDFLKEIATAIEEVSL